MAQEKKFALSAPFDHEKLMQEVHLLTEEYPSVTLAYLGESMLARPIPYLRIGCGRREVLYVGAHHGMEWITSALLCDFARDLAATAATDGRVGRITAFALLQTHTFYILPMLNPDGVEYQIHGINEENPLYDRLLEMNGGSTDFSRWQANARGVDLNHNYDAGFSEYKMLEQEMGILQGAPTRYSGEAPESEVEVARLCTFIRFHRKLCGVMTLHTQGEEIYTHPRLRPAWDLAARKLGALTGYRLATATGPTAYGGLCDWCMEKIGIPAFTVECGRGENPLPVEDFPALRRQLREALFTFPTLL